MASTPARAGFDHDEAGDGACLRTAVDDDVPEDPAPARGWVPPAQVVGPRARPRLHRAAARGQHAALQARGGAEWSPRPVTTTGRPRRSSRAAGSGGVKTRAGYGGGTAPGQPGVSVLSMGCSDTRGSPHGTQRTCSPGVRPPCTTAVATAS